MTAMCVINAIIEITFLVSVLESSVLAFVDRSIFFFPLFVMQFVGQDEEGIY
mgnify:CR=1 FL=1